jgi:hypothetical protein
MLPASASSIAALKPADSAEGEKTCLRIPMVPPALFL